MMYMVRSIIWGSEELFATMKRFTMLSIGLPSMIISCLVSSLSFGPDQYMQRIIMKLVTVVKALWNL
jgi:hypothetical protein